MDRFKRIIDILTVFILVFGLFFACDQAKKLTDSLNMSSVASLGSQSLEVHKVWVTNPEFQKYFFEGSPIHEEDPNYGKAGALADMMLDYFDTTLAVAKYASEHLPEPNNIDYQAWLSFAKDVLVRSPFLCRRYLATFNTYGSVLKHVAEAAGCQAH